MEAKVIQRFRDAKNPSRVYGIGETFTGSDERVAELERKGFVKAMSASEMPAEPAPVAEAAKAEMKAEKAPEKASKKRKAKKKTGKE